MQDDTDTDLDTKHLVVLSKREINSLVHCARMYAGAALESPTLVDLLAAPVAPPRYLLVIRDGNSDGRDDFDIERIGTYEALVARVASYVIKYYDDVRAFDYGVEIDNVEHLPEVAAAVVAHRTAEQTRCAEQTRERRKHEYLRLKAEFEPAAVKDTSA